MLPTVRDLVADLEQAGFINRGGKGSHRNPKLVELLRYRASWAMTQSPIRSGL
jgi:hypothetical protein